MKRILITLVVIVLLFTSSALAEFDISVFNNSSTYTVEYSEMSGLYAITADWKIANNNRMNPDGGMSLKFIPVIAFFEGKGALICFKIEYLRYFSWKPVQSVVMKVGDVRYSFTRTQTAEPPPSTDKEIFYLFLGSSSMPIVKAISDDPAIGVKVRLNSPSGHEDFEMNSTVKDNIKAIYTGYTSAGGFEQLPEAIANMELYATVVTID